MNTSANGGLLAALNKASSAEDFFALLDVPYDAKVLNVMRLHILRRMGQYLVNEDFSGVAEPEVAERCKTFLQQAYEDFIKSSPLDERVFKVLKDAVAPPKPPSNFVSIDVLK